VTLTEGFVESSDGLRLHYEVDGPPEAPLLICAAGGPGRASEYLEDLGGLTATRRVVRVDTRGTGRSQAPDDPSGYAPDRLVDDLERLRVELGASPVDVLGHSAGGPAALGYAAAHPEQVRRLVLVTTYLPQPGGDPDQEFAQAVESDRERIRSSRSEESWYPEAAEAIEAMPYARPAEQQRLNRLIRPFYYGVWNDRTAAHASAADRQMNPRAEQGIRQQVVAADGLNERLLGSAAPTLVLGAELDVITPPRMGQRLAERLPSAQFAMLSGVGHFPWVDGPEQFAAAVEKFLSAD
jgi:pimeloyl-ACP methyl ester carboxylesterase